MKIHIEHLYKYYGKKVALNDISLDIENGMFGLLGENGAGKSTLLKILATVLGKSNGKIEMDGASIDEVEIIRNKIGYMPQDFSFYPNYTVWEIVEYFAALSCIKVEKKNIEDILNSVNLLSNAKSKVKSLSGGMKRRLGIAAAIIHSPQILLIDEPTVGLDPQERMNFRNMLSKLAETKTIILSTHIIPDIEETCDKLAIMSGGEIIYKGNTLELLERVKGRVWEISGELDLINRVEKDYVEKILIVSRKFINNTSTIRVISDADNLENAILVKPCLEDAYMDVVRKC